MKRGYTPCHPKLWALKKDATSFSYVVTTAYCSKEEIAGHKEHFLKFYPDSIFKIQKTEPKVVAK